MRLKGSDCTIFSLGGESLLGELQEVTYQATIGDEDGSAINEISEDPEAISRMRQINGTAFVEDVPTFVAIAESSNPVITFNMNLGGLIYSGTALITQAEHQVRRKALQQQRFTLKIKKTPTVTEEP